MEQTVLQGGVSMDEEAKFQELCQLLKEVPFTAYERLIHLVKGFIDSLQG